MEAQEGRSTAAELEIGMWEPLTGTGSWGEKRESGAGNREKLEDGPRIDRTRLGMHRNCERLCVNAVLRIVISLPGLFDLGFGWLAIYHDLAGPKPGKLAWPVDECTACLEADLLVTSAPGVRNILPPPGH
jgi:hypothetical protein